jgi:fucose permease
MIAAYVALGLPTAALGVAWSTMRTDFDRPLSSLGVLIVTYTIGFLVATVVHRRVGGALGTGWLLVAASGVAVAGAAGFALGPVWAVVVGAAVLLGLSAGTVDATLNSQVALFHSRRVMNLMHGGFGIGATLGPLAMTALLAAGVSWRWCFAGLAATQLALAAAFAGSRRAWPSLGTALVPQPVAPRPVDATALDDASGERSGPPEPTPPAARLGPLVFLVYGALEVAVGAWAFVLLTGRGVPSTAAGILVTAYWGALAAGRLALGAVGDRAHPATVVTAAVSITSLGCLGLWLLPPVGAAVSLVLVGLGLSGIFPALMVLTPARVGTDRAPSVIGLQLAAAVIGGAAGSAIIGVVAQHHGSDAIAPALAVTCMALVVSDIVLTAASTRSPRLH